MRCGFLIALILGLSILTAIPIIPIQQANAAAASQPLTAFSTDQKFSSVAGCFQGNGFGSVTHVFKPSGLVYWFNDQGGNMTLPLVGTSPTRNSTTIHYHFALGPLSGDIYWKQLAGGCPAGNSGNSFKFTLIGTSAVVRTFSLPLGNPKGLTIVCDNAAHTIMIGAAGLNFTDATNFAATCTSASISFTIGAGPFRIDPVTIGTTTAAPPNGDTPQRRLVQDQTRYWYFYSDGTNFGYRTCLISAGDCRTNAASWSSFNTIRAAVTGRFCSIDWLSSTSGIYYVCALQVATGQFFERDGVLVSDGTITWNHAEVTKNTARTRAFIPTILGVSTTDIWVALNTRVGGGGTNYHLEVYRCITACQTNTNWIAKKDMDANSTTLQLGGIMLKATSGYEVVYWDDGVSVASVVGVIRTTNTGTNWNSITTSTCIYTLAGALTIGDTIYFTGAVAGGGGCTIGNLGYMTESFGSSWSSTSVLDSATTISAASISTDGTKCILVYSDVTNSVIEYKQSSDCSAANYGSVTTLDSGETNLKLNSLTISKDIVSKQVEVGWATGAASPFNVRFDITGVVSMQTKSCSFTAATAPTCTFASNVPINDVAVVGVMTSVSTTTVSSVTDGSNTYALIIRDNVLSAVGDNEAWCSNVATAGTLTVTVNLGVSGTGVIILYDLANAAASCATTGSDDSSGQNALSTSPSVASYTPSAIGLEIGFLNSGCGTLCTVSAGASYTLDNNVANVAQASSESIANALTATTTPFTLSVAKPWNEVSVTFVQAAETTVTIAATCTVDNSGTQGTLTLSGGNPSPTTLLCDGNPVTVTVDKTSSLIYTVPADLTNTRYRFATTVQTRITTTCASGACAADSFTVYFQLQNTYQATPSSPTTWDAALSITVIGTLSGTGSTTGCTISTSNGGGSASCQTWFDYNRVVTLLSPVGGWTGTAPTTFSDTTGGNTDTVTYTKSSVVGFLITNNSGLTLTYTSGGVSGLTTTAATVTVDTGTTLTVAGIYTCTYTVQNASFISQFLPSGVQLYSAASPDSLSDFTVGTSPRLMFTETGHVIACIPTPTAFVTDKLFASAVQQPLVFNSPNLFFVGNNVNEIDFFPPPPPASGPAAPTISPEVSMAGPLTIIVFAAFAFLFLAARRKKNPYQKVSPPKTYGQNIRPGKVRGENHGPPKPTGSKINKPRVRPEKRKRNF